MNGELAIAREAVNGILLMALYLPTIWLAWRWLIPRLSPPCRWLALGMLAAQLLLLLIALIVPPAPQYENWLWNVDWEYNAPATLASLQLALVGGLALLTSWLASARPVLERLFLALLTPAFIFLAWDEYFMLHESIWHWERYYTALGIAIVAGTILIAARSPKRARRWHGCLVAGLAISVIGAFFLESHGKTCHIIGLARISGCLPFYYIEEAFEFLGIWLALLGMAGLLSQVVPRPGPRLRLIILTMPALWMAALVMAALMPRMEMLALARPAAARFESSVTLEGYRIELAGGRLSSRLYLTGPARGWNLSGLGFSVHLVDQAGGDSVAGKDAYAGRKRDYWILDPGYWLTHRERIDFAIPPGAPRDRALWIALSLWNDTDGDYARQAVVSSDLPLLSETQVILGELALPDEKPAMTSPPLATFSNGFSLQSVDLPPSAKASQPLPVSFMWRSEVDSDGGSHPIPAPASRRHGRVCRP